MFVVIIFYELGALMPVPPCIRGLQITCKPKIKLVQYEKIMNYLLLPPELKQRHKTGSNISSFKDST